MLFYFLGPQLSGGRSSDFPQIISFPELRPVINRGDGSPPNDMMPAYNEFLQSIGPSLQQQNELQQQQQQQKQQQLQQEQQHPNPIKPAYNEFQRSELSISSQEPLRTRTHSKFEPLRIKTEPGLEPVNEQDLILIASIKKRTVLRGLVREYIDSKRGILEIYQVGHSGLLSEPVAGNLKYV